MQTGYQMNAAEPGLQPQPLPFVPEPIESLAARYPAALVRIWNADAVAAFHAEGMPTDRPMLHRAHVFDLACGVRLGVSSETPRTFPDGAGVHVSASLESGASLETELAALHPGLRIPTFLKRVRSLLVSITGRDDWSFIGATRGAFHYYAPVRSPE